MRVVETIRDCRSALADYQKAGQRIGFVPTMGALHKGHLSLVEVARRGCDRVVVSIFVNPAQFGPGEDFERYPRDLEGDLAALDGRGVDLVFAPSEEEMYPSRLTTAVVEEQVADKFEGEARPGHFDGVLTVVCKLFHIVDPQVAIFGQKDAQQAAAVRRMVKDLDFQVEIIVAPTIREDDGLACSSRNAYLSADDRARATALYRALSEARKLYDQGKRNTDDLLAVIGATLEREEGVDVEYVAIVDRDRFEPVSTITGPCVAALSARVGGIHLIDNVILGDDDG